MPVRPYYEAAGVRDLAEPGPVAVQVLQLAAGADDVRLDVDAGVLGDGGGGLHPGVAADAGEQGEPALADDIQRADRPYGTFYLSFTSTQRDVPAPTDWLSRTLQPQLSTLQGVQRVTVEGGRPLAMRVWIDPTNGARHYAEAGP